MTSEARAQPAGAPRLNLRRYVPALITILSNKLSRGATKFYQAHFGVGSIEWRVMALLAIEPRISGSRICRVSGIDKAAVSRSLALMHELGLISFAGNSDGRQQLAMLTSKGISLHDRIIKVALERQRRLLSCLTTEEQEQLTTLLDRLHANFAAVDEPLALELS